MKRIGDLYSQIISLDNLFLADRNARKGKQNTYGVRLFDRNRIDNLLSLQEQLRNHTYKTSEYSTFTIYEPKERIIYKLPYFPDRIVHHAIMNIMEPIWVSIFTEDTYSCIKGRGIHLAARRVKKALMNNPNETAYCLKIDIRKFYPSVDLEIMKKIVRRKVKDKELLILLDEIIDSSDKGIPIGNYLSQYFANLYLAYFDHWVKEDLKVKYYWRYADDMVFLSDDKQYLHDIMIKIRAYLRDRLKLKVKPNYQVFPVDSRGIDFVGYKFFHTHTLLRKSIKKSFCRKIAKIKKRKDKLSNKEKKMQLCSWYGWAKHADCRNLLNKLKREISYEEDDFIEGS